MPRAVAEPPPPRRVQPLESHASSSADFKDLCYLLTCKSVQEVLRDWGGVISAREQHPSPNPYPNPYLTLTLTLNLIPTLIRCSTASRTRV